MDSGTKVVVIALLVLSLLIGSFYVIGNKHLLYDTKSVTCEVKEKYIKENDTFDGVGYYVRLQSNEYTNDFSVDKKIYNTISIGDRAEAVALFGKKSKDFKGFESVKYFE